MSASNFKYDIDSLAGQPRDIILEQHYELHARLLKQLNFLPLDRKEYYLRQLAELNIEKDPKDANEQSLITWHDHLQELIFQAVGERKKLLEPTIPKTKDIGIVIPATPISPFSVSSPEHPLYPLTPPLASLPQLARVSEYEHEKKSSLPSFLKCFACFFQNNDVERLPTVAPARRTHRPINYEIYSPNATSSSINDMAYKISRHMSPSTGHAVRQTIRRQLEKTRELNAYSNH